MNNQSKIVKIYELLGKAIQEYVDEYDNQLFKDIPIRWDMSEVTPNNIPPTCIIFSGKDWREDKTGCRLERQLDISITYTSKNPREITLSLTKYSEDMKKLIDDFMFNINDFELLFLQGSEIGYLQPINGSKITYKETGTVFNSIIVLSYLVRY